MDATPLLIRVGQAEDGTLTYLVDRTPDALPPVRSRDLAAAWDAAREAAAGCAWGARRLLRFRGGGGIVDLALQDRDARCWAGAVDRLAGLQTSHGLSLCLRLLALVDLLGRASWTAGLCELGRDGAELHPALLRAAATRPLTSEAQFDESGFRSAVPLVLAGAGAGSTSAGRIVP